MPKGDRSIGVLLRSFGALIVALLLLGGGFARAEEAQVDLARVNARLGLDLFADRIEVHKSERRLLLLREGRLLKSYRIALGSRPFGPKEREGDMRTPEGEYYIDFKNDESVFHLSLHISYPNTHDIYNASLAGVEPGGDIVIHGQPEGYKGRKPIEGDWTNGCIALSDAEMEEVYRAVPLWTPIGIYP